MHRQKRQKTKERETEEMTLNGERRKRKEERVLELRDKEEVKERER